MLLQKQILLDLMQKQVTSDLCFMTMWRKTCIKILILYVFFDFSPFFCFVFYSQWSVLKEKWVRFQTFNKIQCIKTDTSQTKTRTEKRTLHKIQYQKKTLQNSIYRHESFLCFLGIPLYSFSNHKFCWFLCEIITYNARKFCI